MYLGKFQESFLSLLDKDFQRVKEDGESHFAVEETQDHLCEKGPVWSSVGERSKCRREGR